MTLSILLVFCANLVTGQQLVQNPEPSTKGARGQATGQFMQAEPSKPLPNPLINKSLALNEGFDDISSLVPGGWFMQNNSDPAGITGWFQGNDGVFPAYDGDPIAYIAANWNNVSGTGTISNWLVTPELSIVNGNEIRFRTRTAAGTTWPDRLQLRMSLSGSSTDVGTFATDVGDFTTLLLDINATYTLVDYPDNWTEFTITISGVPTPTQGRFALRYFVEDGGTGANSNYIGIDRFVYEDFGPLAVPLSPLALMLGFGLMLAGSAWLFLRRG